MNHTQLATAADLIMQPHWGALKEGVTHVLLCSSTQGVDVIPVAQNYEREGLAGNLWQSSLQHEAGLNIPCVQILSAEDYSHLPEVQTRRGHIIQGTHYSFLSGGSGQISQDVHAYIEGTWDSIDVVNTAGTRTRNVIECAYKGYLVDNVSATSLIDHLGGLVFLNPTIDRSTTLISAMLERFAFRNRDEVMHFLRQNRFLIALLLESEEKIGVEFGNRVQLILQVVRDPESDHDDELFLIVKTTLSPEEASESLERLDKNWWVEASSSAQCKLNIDYELA